MTTATALPKKARCLGASPTCKLEFVKTHGRQQFCPPCRALRCSSCHKLGGLHHKTCTQGRGAKKSPASDKIIKPPKAKPGRRPTEPEKKLRVRSPWLHEKTSLLVIIEQKLQANTEERERLLRLQADIQAVFPGIKI